MKNRYAFNVERVEFELRKEYKNFAHYNRKEPLDELVLLLCSVKRSEPVYLKAFNSIKHQFQDYSTILKTPLEDLVKKISWGGLQNQKSVALKKMLEIITSEFGQPTLSPLIHFPDEECERFLTNLPGVGKKVARCVMLFSLNRKVFPVDTHCLRICTRLGWIKQRYHTKAFNDKDMDRLQEKIPPEFRFSLHVNMISHGRKICKARHPKCHKCGIASFCRKIGAKCK